MPRGGSRIEIEVEVDEGMSVGVGVGGKGESYELTSFSLVDEGCWRLEDSARDFALEVLEGTTPKVLGPNTVSIYIFCKVKNPRFGWLPLYMISTYCFVCCLYCTVYNILMSNVQCGIVNDE